jgi:chromosome segregation ATPase
MVRGKYLLIALVLATLVLWGCNQGGNSGGQAERIKSLEARCAKLEDDYRAAATVRDQARKKAQTLEEDLAQLQKDFAAQKKQRETEQEEANVVTKERNELRQIVESRTSERDVLQTRCERLKKGLQNLLGQDEAATSAPPPVTTGPTSLGGQSE